MTGSKVRVRYAPSPTGEPHLGNLRTALFDWLFARSLGGVFIVREEDTDQARKIDEAMDLQKLSLNWLGLDWDEGLGKDGKYGPYVQSRRLDYYQKIAQNLLENNSDLDNTLKSNRELVKINYILSNRKDLLEKYTVYTYI